MPATTPRLLQWSARGLGLSVSLFIGMFALDAFAPGKPVTEAFADFAIHAIPALVLLAVVLMSFRRAWIGGVVFVTLALLYATAMSNRRFEWMLVISGPLAAVGVLFLWTWFYQRTARVP